MAETFQGDDGLTKWSKLPDDIKNRFLLDFALMHSLEQRMRKNQELIETATKELDVALKEYGFTNGFQDFSNFYFQWKNGELE